MRKVGIIPSGAWRHGSLKEGIMSRRTIAIALILACCLPLVVSFDETPSSTWGRRLLNPRRSSTAHAGDDLDEPTFSWLTAEEPDKVVRRRYDFVLDPPSGSIARRSFKRIGDWSRYSRRSKNKNVNVNSNTNVMNSPMEPSSQRLAKYMKRGSSLYILPNLIVKLYAAIVFRENLLFVFGHVLHYPERGVLNLHQSASLELIWTALRNKMVDTFGMLPILRKLAETKDRKQKMKIVMQALVKALPPYLGGAATFWINEIVFNRVDPRFFGEPHKAKLDLLSGLGAELINICRTQSALEHMKAYDTSSRYVEEMLGPVFVKIFQQLSTKKVEMSQQLFGIILANLVQLENNPILEENIQYILDVTQEDLIPNWNKISNDLETNHPRTLISSTIDRILDSQLTPLNIKYSLSYIAAQLELAESTSFKPTNQETDFVAKNGFNISLILSPITPNEFGPEMARLKDRLIFYVQSAQISMPDILNGMNWFAQDNAKDMLIALLARLQRRVPSFLPEIQETISSLLAGVTIRTEACKSSLIVQSPKIDISLLLESAKTLNANPKLRPLIDSILEYLVRKPRTLIALNKLVPHQREKCLRPMQCLMNTLSDADEASDTKVPFPDELIAKMREAIPMISEALVEDQSERPLRGPYPPSDPTLDHDVVVATDPLLGQSSLEVTISTPDSPIDNSPTENPDDNPDGESKQVYIIEPNENTEVPPKDIDSFLENNPIDEDDDEDESSPPALPPNIRPNQPIYIVIDEKGVPLIDTSDTRPDEKGVTLPSVNELLEPPEPNRPLINLPLVFERIIKPLSALLGPNYMQKILGQNVNIERYPTNIALITDILSKAVQIPAVKSDVKLLQTMKEYITGINYISPIVLLPLVTSFLQINSKVIWGSYDPKDPQDVSVHDRPFVSNSPNILTFPIFHPKFLVQSVDPQKPFEDLLPTSTSSNINLLPLREILTRTKIAELLGKTFNPLIYPNKGALLISLLQKLQTVSKVKANPAIMQLLKGYLTVLQQASVGKPIPQAFIHKTTQTNNGNWQPELISLMQTLPPAKNEQEVTMLRKVKTFLSQPNLFELLQIPIPSPSTTRGQLLQIIIGAALNNDKVNLDGNVVEALIYYQDKIQFTGYGALPIVWVWVQVYVFRTEVKLGEVIESVIDFDKLSYENKLAYNDLVTYLSQNQEILQNNSDFQFEKYRTRGNFLRALFAYLLQKTNVAQEAKNNIKVLLPFVSLSGSGALKMPRARIEKLASRRSWRAV